MFHDFGQEWELIWRFVVISRAIQALCLAAIFGGTGELKGEGGEDYQLRVGNLKLSGKLVGCCDGLIQSNQSVVCATTGLLKMTLPGSFTKVVILNLCINSISRLKWRSVWLEDPLKLNLRVIIRMRNRFQSCWYSMVDGNMRLGIALMWCEGNAFEVGYTSLVVVFLVWFR